MHFIGHTGLIQTTLVKKLTRIRDTLIAGQPVDALERRQLFTGPPGVGKTHLASQLAALLAGQLRVDGGNQLRAGTGTDASAPDSQLSTLNSQLPHEVERLNGANLSLDLVRQWTAHAHYRPMFGPVSVKFVDEIDAVGPAALNDLRTYLDQLAPHRVFLACTNKPVAQLQEQLQSRFQVWTFRPVSADELAAHLQAKYQLNPASARDIALGAKGNVRSAEADALSLLDVLSAQAA